MNKFIINLVLCLLMINVVSAVVTYSPSSFAGFCDSYVNGNCNITISKTFTDIDNIMIKDFRQIILFSTISVTNMRSGVGVKGYYFNFTNITNIWAIYPDVGAGFYTTGTAGSRVEAGDINVNVSNDINLTTFQALGTGVLGTALDGGKVVIKFKRTYTSNIKSLGGSALTAGAGGKILINGSFMNVSTILTKGGTGGSGGFAGDMIINISNIMNNSDIKAQSNSNTFVPKIIIKGRKLINNLFSPITSTFLFNVSIMNMNTIAANFGHINITSNQITNNKITTINSGHTFIKSNFFKGSVNVSGGNNKLGIISREMNLSELHSDNLIVLNGTLINILYPITYIDTMKILGNKLNVLSSISAGARLNISVIRINQTGSIATTTDVLIRAIHFYKTSSLITNKINISVTRMFIRNNVFNTLNNYYNISFLKVYNNITTSGPLKLSVCGNIRQFIPLFVIKQPSLLNFNYTNQAEGNLLFDSSMGPNNLLFKWSNNNSKKVNFNYTTNLNINQWTCNAGLEPFEDTTLLILSAKDRQTNTSLSSFNVTINGTTYINVNQQIQTNITKNNKKFNITFSAPRYFNLSYRDKIITKDVQANMTFYRARIEISAHDGSTGNKINTFNNTISNFLISYFNSTINGKDTFLIDYNQTYNVLIDTFGYELKNKSILPNTNQNSITKINFSLLPSGILFMTFKDALTKNLVDFITVNIELINPSFSGNFTTNNGTKKITGIIPGDYIIRYSALPKYYQSFYAFTLGNRQSANLTLYLANTSVFTITTATVYDEINHRVENAKIEVMKYDSSTGNYLLTEICITNFEGECQIKTILANEFYKFNVRYNNILKFSSANPTYIFKNTINFQITIGEEIGKRFFNIEGIDYSLVFNNATNNFRLVYSDSKAITQAACLRVERTYGITKTLIDDKCNVGAAGTILVPIVPLNDAKFTATAYTIASPPTVLQTLVQIFSTTAATGLLGLFFVWLLTIIFPFIAIWKPPLAFILTPLPLLFGSIAGIIDISIAYTIPLELLGLVLAYFVSDRS